MIKAIIYSFFLAQILFTLLDLAVLYRQKKLNSHFKISDHKQTLFFIAGVWVVYFILQNVGVAILPGFNSLRDHLFHWLGISSEGETLWSWKVTLMFLWSFHVVGFWDFVTHRWVLHRKQFWIFHEYHHLPRMVFNGMPGISVRPFVFFTTLLTYVSGIIFLLIPLKFILSPEEARGFIEWGIPLLVFSLTLVLSVGHSLFLRKFWGVHSFLKYLLIATPQEHVLHHSIKLRCNYGNFSTVWDRLFHSYVDPRTVDIYSEPLGLDYDQDYLGTLCLGKIKLSKETRQRFRLEDTVC
ncbi:MAG TPA: sterol desaturase family protein, partial [Bdellovibrio sp.]|nr:sterol desaturase family protein [Bdellovibrio sp.]